MRDGRLETWLKSQPIEENLEAKRKRTPTKTIALLKALLLPHYAIAECPTARF
jgi:hypothetical protein